MDNDTDEFFDVFRKELATGDIVRVSTASDGTQGNGGGTGAQISADGRFVVFESNSDELVAGDVNQVPDIFLEGPCHRKDRARVGCRQCGQNTGQ